MAKGMAQQLGALVASADDLNSDLSTHRRHTVRTNQGLERGPTNKNPNQSTKQMNAEYLI